MTKQLGKKEIDLMAKAYSSGKPIVIPTDTIYGITVPALDKKAVLNLYKLKKRDKEKPFIILVSSLRDIALFGVKLSKEEKKWLQIMWPGKITAIFRCNDTKFKYLYRNKKALSFRIPDDKWLIKAISKLGPLVAPSANIQGCEPSITIEEAFDYFKDKALYIDAGRLNKKPSTIVSFVDGFKIIREGSLKLKKNEYFRPDINN
ncbi:L-threonylcarbamoyladenylate synthase [bacterium]|nr:L-threonylcarbamoyladenylate synthase [bacterium]